MKKHIYRKLTAIVALSLSLPTLATEPESNDSVEGFRFTDVKVNPTTPVKNQNKSGTCWSFAGTAQLENEILKNGGPEVDLSEMFVVRQVYLDKADKYVRLGGNGNFGPGGAITDVPYVYAVYGALPEEAYPGNEYGEEGHVHGELDAVLTAYLNAVNKHPNRRLSTAWRKGLEGILDAYLGPVPETFNVGGKTYTPQSYAKELGLSPDDYVAFTSFTHHPFYTSFPLEVADNWLWADYNNVPMEDLRAIVDNAIDKGYTVVWAADVSEPGFKWNKGVALMPVEKDGKDLEGTELSRWVKLTPAERQREKYNFNGPCEEQIITQEMRQTMFDRMETTDDHGMVIVGKAKDQTGKPYYKVKNSWGDDGHIYNGYFYVSEPYFLAKTLSILVNKKALTSDQAKKSNVK